MKYLKNSQKLLDVLTNIAQHETNIADYFYASLNPRINVSSYESDKIIHLFIIANADRQGKGKDNINLINASASFKQYLASNEFKNLTKMDTKDAYQEFCRTLCDIKGMDQKTANLFLKYLVMFQAQFSLSLYDWKSWEYYLDVPLDMWVLRLLGVNYLNVCNDEYEKDFKYRDEYTSPGYRSQKYSDLQADIKELSSQLNRPAIMLDGLWFIGSKYCTYRPLLCGICWLTNYCVSNKTIPWPTETIASKTLEKEQRKQYNKQILAFHKQIQSVWLTENPGKSKIDFLTFMKTSEFTHWLKQFLPATQND